MKPFEDQHPNKPKSNWSMGEEVIIGGGVNRSGKPWSRYVDSMDVGEKRTMEEPDKVQRRITVQALRNNAQRRKEKEYRVGVEGEVISIERIK